MRRLNILWEDCSVFKNNCHDDHDMHVSKYLFQSLQTDFVSLLALPCLVLVQHFMELRKGI